MLKTFCVWSATFPVVGRQILKKYGKEGNYVNYEIIMLLPLAYKLNL